MNECKFKKGDIVESDINSCTKGRRFMVVSVKEKDGQWLVTSKMVGSGFWPLECKMRLNEGWLKMVKAS